MMPRVTFVYKNQFLKELNEMTQNLSLMIGISGEKWFENLGIDAVTLMKKY